MTEPFSFAVVDVPLAGRLFRVARPGRGIHGPDGRPVSEEAVHAWVHGVANRLIEAGMAEPLDVDYVCLLGRKPGGLDEIADFYPARRPYDDSQPDRPTFGEMLNRVGNERIRFTVHHLPTDDHEDLPAERIEEIRSTLFHLLGEHRTVLIGCSAGETRTGTILAAMRRAAMPSTE